MIFQKKFLLLLCTLQIFCGCDTVSPAFSDKPILSQLKHLVRSAARTIVGGTSSPSPKPNPLRSPNTPEFISSAAQNSKAHAELFHEMYRVVFNREPKDRNQFGNWVDTLNQGASLEGVHNGLIRSNEFRKLELSQGAASVEALKAFSEELAVLEAELPKPTLFDPLNFAPIPTDPNQPFQSPSPTALELTARISQLAAGYPRQFVGAPVFSLKRILTDEAIKVIDTKNTFKENLARWYSQWVLHMAKKKIDFGIVQRNLPNEAMHYKWAIEASTDRLKWEVFNRIHRVMNETNRQKQ